jgi:hypothetical protein
MRAGSVSRLLAEAVAFPTISDRSVVPFPTLLVGMTDNNGGSAGRRLTNVGAVNPKMRRPRRELLAAEMHRKAPPTTVDLVLARHDEDISWLSAVLSDMPHVNTWVYEKGRKTPSAECAAMNSVHCVPTPRDVGRESAVYLTHILDRYDRLANKTVFAQAGEPSVGYTGPGDRSGHMHPDADFAYDFLAPTTPPLVLPSFFREADGPQMGVLNSFNNHTIVGASDRVMLACDPSRAWTVWEDPRPPWQPLLRYQPEQMSTTRAFWERHIAPELGPLSTDRLYFANGGILSAGRDAIKKASKGLYRDLLHQVDHAVDPVAGYHLEHLWGYLLGHGDALKACDKLHDVR